MPFTSNPNFYSTRGGKSRKGSIGPVKSVHRKEFGATQSSDIARAAIKDMCLIHPDISIDLEPFEHLGTHPLETSNDMKGLLRLVDVEQQNFI